MKVRFESSHLSDFLESAFSQSHIAIQLDISCQNGGYNQIRENIINPGSPLYSEPPDVLILLPGAEFFGTSQAVKTPFSAARSLVDDLINQDVQSMAGMLECLEDRLPDMNVVVANIPIEPISSLGTLERNHDEFSVVEAFEKLNREIAAKVRSYRNAMVFDIDSVCRNYGWRNLIDKRLDYVARSPYSKAGLELLAVELAKIFHAICLPQKKCIVLDLDNTLWGGIVGEDGFDGIQVGNDGPARAYYEFQIELKNFLQRGIILAVVSKNNEADAMEVMSSHPGMVLSPKHFASIRINWKDKASNIKDIADELNIGLDSMVFLDDSPVEREWVRTALPEVEVVDLPKDPVDYRQTLIELTSLSARRLTKEDLGRLQSYQNEHKRRKEMVSFENFEDYLKSLKMKICVDHLKQKTLQRITQLINKTNQFNLTTRRYDEAEIRNLAHQPERFKVLSLRLSDKFDNYGIVGVAILEKEEEIAKIDTLLLSCRVLGRNVETAFLSEISRQTRNWNCIKLFGEYIPSAKNSQVADFFSQHGFIVSNETDSSVLYLLSPPMISSPQYFKVND